MKKIILLLSLFSNIALAENPSELFSTADNFTNETKIKWIQVTAVQTACNNQRIKNGGKPFTYAVKACSSWSKNIIGSDECIVITEKKTSMHIIGHEMRHCFSGFWKGHE